MRISVRTIGRLSGHLPNGATTEAVVEVAPGARLTEVMADLGLSRARDYLVIRNETPIPSAAQGDVRLEEGDHLTILPKPKVG